MNFSEEPLTNSQIAELLAIAAQDAPAPLNKAYRRASRKALLWPEEVSKLLFHSRSCMPDDEPSMIRRLKCRPMNQERRVRNSVVLPPPLRADFPRAQ